MKKPVGVTCIRMDITNNSQIGRLRRPFPRPSWVGGMKCIRTDTNMKQIVGQTHMWDRHTCGTDTHMGQTHI